MNFEQAKEILEVPRHPRDMWSDFVYEFYNGVTKAKIGGKFTSDELKAIAWCIENKVPNRIIDEDGKIRIKLYNPDGS